MKTCFFDLDDTLYDRENSFYFAYEKYFGKAEREYLDKAFAAWQFRGNEVFMPSQRGEISMEEMYIYRIQKAMADLGVEISDKESLDFQAAYADALDNIYLTDVVIGILDKCSTIFDRIGVITNGPSGHQRDKIASLDLDKWMDNSLYVISGDLGFDKPDKRIYEHAAKLADKRPRDLVMIGDSFANDVVAAKECGWKAVWRNKFNVEMPKKGIRPDLTIYY